MSKLPDLAWETDVGDAPQYIWRVVSLRKYKDRTVRMVEWFSHESDARQHALIRKEAGDPEVTVTCYRRVD